MSAVARLIAASYGYKGLQVVSASSSKLRVGRIVDVTSDGEVTVRWQSTGVVERFQRDQDGLYSLRVLSSAATVTHDACACDNCYMMPMKGARWSCCVCHNYDLCTKCYCRGEHDVSHGFLRYDTDQAVGVSVKPRSESVKETLKGYLPGCAVKRCRGEGNLGVQERGMICEIQEANPASEEMTKVVIVWEGGCHDETQIAEDSEFEVDAMSHGWSCYRDHLQQLGEPTRVSVSPSLTMLEEEMSKVFNYTKSGTVKVRSIHDCYALILLGVNLVTLPDALGSVISLPYLNINYCIFEGNKLHRDIGQYSHITFLSLTNCGLASLPNEIGELSALNTLFVDCNNLCQLPHDIGSLSLLVTCSMCNNQLKALPVRFQELENLEIFWACKNQFLSIPETLCQLPRLQRVNLSDNRLRIVTKNLSKASSLTELFLDGNQLQELPRELFDLSELRKLVVDRNPLQLPPLQVCQNGIESVRSYFEDPLSARVVMKSQKKVVIIGRSGAGKTSLVFALIDQKRTDPRSKPCHTQGVKYHLWRSMAEGSRIPMDLYVLDFGGRDIYYQTYRLFLAENTLVVVAVNIVAYEVGNKESFMDHVGQWVQQVQTHTPTAEVLLVITHADCCHNTEERVLDISYRVDELQQRRSILIEKMIEQAGNLLKKAILVHTIESQAELVEYHKELCTMKERRLRLHKKAYCVSNVCLEGIDKLTSGLLWSCQKSLTCDMMPYQWQQVLEALVREQASATALFIKRGDFEQNAVHQPAEQVLIRGWTPHRTGESQNVLGSSVVCFSHVRKALRYYHELDDVLYYPESPYLRDHVCVHPQKLMDVYSQILSQRLAETLEYKGVVSMLLTKRLFRDMKESLYKKGLMSRKLFSALCLPAGT